MVEKMGFTNNEKQGNTRDSSGNDSTSSTSTTVKNSSYMPSTTNPDGNIGELKVSKYSLFGNHRFPRTRRGGFPSNNLSSDDLTFTNPKKLKTFMTEGGRICPRRFTCFSAKQQRACAKQIKRSRCLLLIPCSAKC